MSGWNRLFILVAICWAVVAPFWIRAETNAPIEQTYRACSWAAYELYGSSTSRLLDMNKHDAEEAKCREELRGLVGINTLFNALIGKDDPKHPKLSAGLWIVILVPLALLWVGGWGLGRVVRWVAGGFQRP
jgi:hypothetical protein